uniref:Cytochrome b6-f complex subunit 6 n=1 Tax=Lobochlamys segnis TaxID=52035 RepID=A0A0S2IBH8_9CHLO|nr:subunit VI of cytochrome b6/f complex [Lobochlamys segnis]
MFNEEKVKKLNSDFNFFIFFNMLTLTSYVVLLIGALVFTLSLYLGLLKVVKII